MVRLLHEDQKQWLKEQVYFKDDPDLKFRGFREDLLGKTDAERERLLGSADMCPPAEPRYRDAEWMRTHLSTQGLAAMTTLLRRKQRSASKQTSASAAGIVFDTSLTGTPQAAAPSPGDVQPQPRVAGSHASMARPQSRRTRPSNDEVPENDVGTAAVSAQSAPGTAAGGLAGAAGRSPALLGGGDANNAGEPQTSMISETHGNAGASGLAAVSSPGASNKPGSSMVPDHLPPIVEHVALKEAALEHTQLPHQPQ